MNVLETRIFVCVNPQGDLELWEARIYDVYRTATPGWYITIGDKKEINIAPGGSIDFWNREVLGEL